MKKEIIHILLILIGLMLFPAHIGQCKKPIKTHHKIIVIDPGHGGKDTGIVTKTGRTEKNMALKLSGYLAAQLEPHFSVYLTRPEDSFLEDVDRASFANTRNADLFISIHLGNSIENQSRFYFYRPKEEPIPDIPADDLIWRHQALHYARQSRQLCDILSAEFTRHDGSSPCFTAGAPVKSLSGCQMPAVAIEPFSLKILSGSSSPEEILKGYAHWIAKSIESFFSEK